MVAACLVNALNVLSTVAALKAKNIFTPHGKWSPLSFMKLTHEVSLCSALEADAARTRDGCCPLRRRQCCAIEVSRKNGGPSSSISILFCLVFLVQHCSTRLRLFAHVPLIYARDIVRVDAHRGNRRSSEAPFIALSRARLTSCPPIAGPRFAGIPRSFPEAGKACRGRETRDCIVRARASGCVEFRVESPRHPLQARGCCHLSGVGRLLSWTGGSSFDVLIFVFTRVRPSEYVNSVLKGHNRAGLMNGWPRAPIGSEL